MKLFVVLIFSFSFSAIAGLTPQKYCAKIYSEDGVTCELLNVEQSFGVAGGGTTGSYTYVHALVRLVKKCVNGQFVVTSTPIAINPGDYGTRKEYSSSSCSSL